MSAVDDATSAVLCQPIGVDGLNYDKIVKNTSSLTTSSANGTEESNLSKIPIYNYINDVIKNHVSEIELSGIFDQETSYKSAYYRNNKANGQKHIRCFPYCADTHSDKAFCGRPVSIVISMLVKKKPNGVYDYSGKFDNMKFLSYFKPQDEDILFDQSLTPSELKSALLRREGSSSVFHNNTTIFLGKVIYRQQPVTMPEGIMHRCLVEFNAECKGWHYSWIGNRFTPTERHVLAVSAVVPEICDSDIPRSEPQLEGYKKLRDNANFKDTQSYISDMPNETDPFPFQIRYKPVAHFSSPPFTIASMRGRREKITRLNITPTPHPPPMPEGFSYTQKGTKYKTKKSKTSFDDSSYIYDDSYDNDYGEDYEDEDDEEDYFEDYIEDNIFVQSYGQSSSSTSQGTTLAPDQVQGKGDDSASLFRQTMSIMQSDDYEKADDRVYTEGVVTRKLVKKCSKETKAEKKMLEKVVRAQASADFDIEPRNPLKGVGGVSIADLHLKSNIRQITIDNEQARNFVHVFQEIKTALESESKPPITVSNIPPDIIVLPKRKFESPAVTLREIDILRNSTPNIAPPAQQSNEQLAITTTTATSSTTTTAATAAAAPSSQAPVPSEEINSRKYFKPNPIVTLETLVASRALMHDSFEAESSGAVSLLALVSDLMCTGGTGDDLLGDKPIPDPTLLSSLSRENKFNDTILYRFMHHDDENYTYKKPNTKFKSFNKLTCNFHRNNTYSLVSEQAKSAKSLSHSIPIANSLRYKVGDKVWATDGISSFANVETYYSGEILTYNSDFSLVLIKFSRVGKFENSDCVARQTWLPSFFIESHVHLGDRRNRKTKRRP